jgi:hypothetical protein
VLGINIDGDITVASYGTVDKNHVIVDATNPLTAISKIGDIHRDM